MSKKPKAERKLTLAELALLSEKDKKFDASATEDDCIADLRKVQELNPLKFITRNFYRVNGKYSDSTWNCFFGTFKEFRRQAGLELDRHQHRFEQKIAIQASLDTYRNFYQKEVLPYHNKFDIGRSTGRFKLVLTGSDFHDIECDPFTLETFIDTAKRTQPDLILLNGDVFDLYEASSFDQDIRHVKIVERFDFVKEEIFAPLREYCPNAQIDFIIGNHEWRLLKLLANKTPAIRVILSDVMGLTLSDVFGLDEYQINLVAKLDLAAFKTTDENSELRENFKIYYDCFVASHFKNLHFGLSGTSGHSHRPEMITFANLPMGKLNWVTTGCIARTRAEYIQGMDEWTNSFSLTHIDTLKRSVSPEHFLIPGDSVVVHGVRYLREKVVEPKKRK